MNIELKNIKHSPSLSEETEAFTANIYIDGVLAGYASNRGHGGPTDYSHTNEKGLELIRKAEEYCKGLPPKQYHEEGNKKFFMVMNLENYIDDLLGKHLDEKILQNFRNQIKRAMEKSIVVGITDHSFKNFSFNNPIAKILLHPKGTEILISNIRDVVLPKLNGTEQILNTNIPETILKEAGLSKDQYVQQPVANHLGQKQKAEKKNSRKI